MQKCSWFMLLLAVFCFSGFCSCATAPTADTAPLPANPIITQDPNLPPELNAFLGRWSGRWWMLQRGDSMTATLIVETINKDSATVFYRWEGSYSWNVSPGQKRLNVRLFNKDGKPAFSWVSKGNKFVFCINEKGELEGLMGSGDRETRIRMDRK